MFGPGMGSTPLVFTLNESKRVSLRVHYIVYYIYCRVCIRIGLLSHISVMWIKDERFSLNESMFLF